MDDRTQEGVELPSELEFGDETGDRRENDSHSAGYTPEDDRVFRSHFQRANRLADRGFEQVRPAHARRGAAGREPARAAQSFDDLDVEVRNGWLNVRTALGDWASVRDFAREGFERGRALGFIADAPPAGTTPTHDRPSFADPVPGDVDPTSPESPEQTLVWEHEWGDAATLGVDRTMRPDEQRPLPSGAEPGPAADEGGSGWKSSPDATRDPRESE